MKIVTFPGIVFLSLLSFCFLSPAYGANLSPDEVKALKDIAKTIGKTNWDFDVDPCSGQGNWTTIEVKGNENSLTCNCSDVNGTICHVTGIILKQQSLPGKLPPELIRLPYLQEFDVTRNYLNGTIPKEWGSMKFLNISLLGNRLTGEIPTELANITTLKSLVLEYNQFSGNLPPQLGQLPNLERLLITSNNFVGELPSTFANLKTLTDIRMGDNQFSGVIPDFIQNWTNLTKLIIHGTNLSGPIPSEISVLQSLTDLRISDLKGSDSTFPPLSNLTRLKSLILRNCNINDTLPEYLGTMSTLKLLDLSFNKLTGDIPSTFSGLRKVDNIYLSGNHLTGRVPDWTEKADNLDLSYNNFSAGNSVQGCQKGNVNLFASSSMLNDSETAVSCLRRGGCSKTHYFLRINCGGGQVTVNGSKTFDDDSDSAGSARFHEGASDWGFSTTGNFLDNDVADYYIWSNSSRLSMINAELYTRARVSPISLTYYAFCMQNGNYTVNLHFAEIMFTNDNTYNSLGRRIFDIYIQGKRVLQDFNIAKEAGGAGKAVIKPFIAVVTNNTLEIRLFWTGKGTTGIPFKSVYGPLISAISVDPNFTPPSESGSSISAGAVVGIVAAVAIVVVLVFGILWWKGCLGKKTSLANELKGIELQTGLFSLRQIKTATNNFDIGNKIGEGGFGPVYKGLLLDGTIIAVKQLSTKSRQGNREFLNEIGMISALQHPYLVKLYGCCVEGDQLLLIYEYMENNSLARALFGPEESQIRLDWPTRRKICIGIARGLAYLHEESRLKIVHRDIKATNVLLDKDLNPKISDFGLAKLDEEDNTHISTKIAGTYGYMAPEYAMHGYLTDKADVYSFGIVALEIVSGRSNTIHRGKEEAYYLLDWANLLKEKGILMELVDKRLGSNFNQEEVMVMINVALLCTNVTAASRPNMSSVVSMLEGRSVVHELVSDTSEALNEKKLEAMRQYYRQMEVEPNQSISMDGPWTASSASAADLYPVHLDSSYLEKRSN